MAAYLIEERLKMITCKEDLINTYIVKGDDVLTKAYISACKEYVDVYALQCDRWPKDRHLYFNPKYKHIQSGECDTSKYKEITIKDLKPKPTKFVKVEESIFDLKEEFERGELFTKKAWGEYVLIKEDTHLALLYEMQSHENSKIGIYRQVEIDWRDELGLFLAKKAFDGASVNNLDISDLSDKLGTVSVNLELRFNDFIEMCHKVAELTDKPE